MEKWFDQNMLILNISNANFLPILPKAYTDIELDALTPHSCTDYLSNVFNVNKCTVASFINT